MTRYVTAIGCLAAAAACLYPPLVPATDGRYAYSASYRPVWDLPDLYQPQPVDVTRLAAELAAVGLATAGLRQLAGRRSAPQQIQ